MTDRLDAIRCFAAACEEGGFTAAGRRLGLSTSAVTRAVSALEGMLGVRLLHRTTRLIRLTEAGENYLPLARDVLERLANAERVAVASAGTISGRLVVSAPLLFGRLHAARLLAKFMTQHPSVRVDLLLSNRHVGLVGEGVDIAIRIGHLPDSGLLTRSLGEARTVLAASPEYLATRGCPGSPVELAGHRLLASEGVARRRSWLFRTAEDVIKPWPVDPVFFSNNAEAAIAVAEAGGGIVSALSYQIMTQLTSGALVEILQAFVPPPVPIQAILPAGRLIPAAVRTVLDVLVTDSASWAG